MKRWSDVERPDQALTVYGLWVWKRLSVPSLQLVLVFKVVPGRFGDRNLWNRPWVQLQIPFYDLRTSNPKGINRNGMAIRIWIKFEAQNLVLQHLPCYTLRIICKLLFHYLPFAFRILYLLIIETLSWAFLINNSWILEPLSLFS